MKETKVGFHFQDASSESVQYVSICTCGQKCFVHSPPDSEPQPRQILTGNALLNILAVLEPSALDLPIFHDWAYDKVPVASIEVESGKLVLKSWQKVGSL